MLTANVQSPMSTTPSVDAAAHWRTSAGGAVVDDQALAWGLVNRLAATTREGLVAECAGRCPTEFERLEAAEARLSAARRDLLEGYEAWSRALEECADLWALRELGANRALGLCLRAERDQVEREGNHPE